MPAALACLETSVAWDDFPAVAPAVVPWSLDQAVDTYGIHAWGAPYFSVNSAGNVAVRPHGSDTLPYQEIDLMKVVKKTSDPKVTGGLGLQLPLIVRFPDVLRNRICSLQAAFDYAITSNDYESRYQGVYPVKCNQDRYVVEDIVEFGNPFRFGLEAGSKPELLLAMSCLTKAPTGAFLICNGYKDEEYVSLALTARKLDLGVVIVLEQEEELDLVLKASRKVNIRPVIGLRAKLRTKHAGHFGSTSGEKGKFGLTTWQIVSVVRKLRSLEMLDCLQLLHFHIGSQIPSTELLSDGVGEAAQIYCELVSLGACMRVIDIGGGLGIDYDGSKSGGSDMSVAYNLDEYASAVVRAVQYACDRKNVAHPVICSESGRALVSHHSVLVFEAVSSNIAADSTPIELDLPCLAESLSDHGDHGDHHTCLMSAAVHGDHHTCLAYVDELKRRCAEQFNYGTLGLEQLAAVDGFCDLVLKAISASDPVTTYNINLSLFTSVPDFWAIGQLFPILPIHRLDQRPTANGVLSDLTCDSDGKIAKFIGGHKTLPLHNLTGNPGGYYLGMFLGGAYQEALGGLHNLFGGPSVIRVSQSDGPHSFAVTRADPGPSCADVLRLMHHQPEVMFEALKQRVEECGLAAFGDSITIDLARNFNSMPYLKSPDIAGFHGEEEDSDGTGYSGADASCDELEWDIYRCMLE